MHLWYSSYKEKDGWSSSMSFLLPFSSRIRSLSFSCEFKWQATHFQFLHSSINEVWHLGHAHWLNLFERKVHNAAIFKSEKTTTHMQFLSTFEVKHSRVNCVRRFRVLLAVISLQYVFLLGWLSDRQTQIDIKCLSDQSIMRAWYTFFFGSQYNKGYHLPGRQHQLAIFK